MAGSNPAGDVGRVGTPGGQNLLQLVQHQDVAERGDVKLGTPVDGILTTCGHPGWQTKGKQLPDAILRLADIWELVPEHIRMNIEQTATESCSGFSGFQPYSAPQPTPQPSGYSGFSAAASSAA